MDTSSDPKARELTPLNGVQHHQHFHENGVSGGGTDSVGDMAAATAVDGNGLLVTKEAMSRTFCQYEPRERCVITKNVIVIGLAFMIHFTAFHGTSNLQSSVNSDKALGTTTLAVIYGSLLLSNIFLPMAVIRWFGIKLTMALAFFTYMPYIAAQFFPRFETLIPAGFMVGFGGGPLWCAKCTYLSTVAEALSQTRGQKSQKDANTVKFFGVFFIFYQMAQVWGNLISSSVLTLASDVGEGLMNSTSVNTTYLVGEICGARFCPDVKAEVNPNLLPPEPSKIQLLNSIFLICMGGAVLLMLFGVDSLKRYGVKRGDTGGAGMSALKLLTATLFLMRRRKQLLILPITMFIGLESAFLAVDFTKSFVACGWGISNIGFAMICFGVANAIAAGVSGAIAEKMGRFKLVALCAVVNVSLYIYMYCYEAKQGDYITYCAFAAIWGICDAVWLVVINAFYGILFPENLIAGYSNFRLWESTGSVIGYVISAQFCTSFKLLILIGFLVVGFIGYAFVEYRISKKEKQFEMVLQEKF